jgi:hypothetical protein
MPGHRGEDDNLPGFHHHDDGRCPAVDGGMRSRLAVSGCVDSGWRLDKSREAIAPQKPDFKN